MTENSTQTSNAFYDPDDVGPRDTPPLTPMRINLQPSPPPATILSRLSPESSSGRKGSNRAKNRPLIGDAILVAFMGGGKRPDIARTAGHEALASDDEEEKTSVKGTEVEIMAEKDRGFDLTALAADALRAHEGNAAQNNSQMARPILLAKQDALSSIEQVTSGEHMEDLKPSMAPINTIYSTEARPRSSPEAVVQIKLEPKGSPPAGELPPIRHSPKSGLPNGNGAGPITLPSISDQLGDLNHLPTEAPAAGESNFSQSPPGRQPPRFTAVPGQASPKSPNDTFRRELPSPGRSSHFFYNSNTHRRPSQAEGGPQYTSAGDYSSSNTETPSTDQSGSTPAMAIDRMSIDGITNPQIGGFQCTYPGCTAQPFQTQYLLNSHANVHSSNRPHYCMVKGCPRGEGGKGFKRKNEMIRHGLVHDSPGYVCPFCPDREHKYPRPDNLQRHVRVHHVDKDKDDPQLREVLSQRPEGPSRGRRRRLNGSS